MKTSRHQTDLAPERALSRRSVLGGASAVAMAATLSRYAPAHAKAERTKVLRSRHLEVTVGSDFPRILSYRDRSGGLLHGATDPVDHVLINGERVVTTASVRTERDKATYRLKTPAGSRIDVSIEVDGWGVEWRVTNIREGGGERIGTLQIPQLRMVAIRSDQPGAELRCGRVELDQSKEGDVVVNPADTSEPDGSARGGAYGVVATDELAAALETNVVYDLPNSEARTTWENGRLWHQVRSRGKATETGFAPGQWTIRPDRSRSKEMEPLPWVRVILTRDRNGDGKVDWQDAAIAMRDIAVTPRGADEQHLRVVAHIPFNFASQATNPFLHTLDSVKRVNLATDGLRQFVLLKGYQSEGHDSAHPDYAGNYNRGAGGLDDLNTLLRKGSRWNSDFAVHVNATESYPVANAFSETLVDVEDEQWDWLDQSYRIDPRRDLVSGDIVRRFADLRRETHRGLNMLYIDVFRESGWNSDGLQHQLRKQGWTVTTEWGHGLERSSIWSHWATEIDYGADESRGINSQLIRMVRHHQKDVFSDRWPAVLPTAKIGNFEGWRGKTDWNEFYQKIWTEALPAKFLQAFPIKTWSAREVTFFASRAVSSRDEQGTQVVSVDGHEVLRGSSYLLPWEPSELTKPAKLYHFNAKGGRTTWVLPSGWRSIRQVYVYRLNDQGRKQVGTVPVRSGKVRLEAKAGEAYAIYRRPAPTQTDPRWGEGTPLRDPGFRSGGLADWKVRGRAEATTDDNGHHQVVLPSGPATTVSQRLRRLEPGHYVLGVHVQVGATAGETRRAEVSVRTGDKTVSRWAERSTAENFVAADHRQGTRMQRVMVPFRVRRDQDRVEVELSAEAGAAIVAFASVRVDEVSGPPAERQGAVIFEDFERLPYGWGPFVKGDAGGSTDPRTHIAQRNAPYTQRGWNGKAIDDVIAGKQSLKSRGENPGLVYRTVPHTVRFTPGRRYEVSFSYQCETANTYEWVTGIDRPQSEVLKATPMPQALRTTTMKLEIEAPADGDLWVGLRKPAEGGAVEFVLDDFEVRELRG
ncbi:endo-alpha-N-acetylgalactosaminidase family protein [Demetria terragena]|uniref:endo-alpha-N-acetylgalactosaminidase family protein n=1 Tax=Demetria terragena TaxID=63959 RepID=UPI00037B2B34|nr:endo-alpha-N-acetylgalactosaminidase family protein [Demetria terragena]